MLESIHAPQEVGVHVPEPRDQEPTAPIDAARTLWGIRLCGGSDPRDPISFDQDSSIGQQLTVLDTDDRRIDDCYTRFRLLGGHDDHADQVDGGEGENRRRGSP
jgi:hypothetical protein